jgi:cytochrome c oxidase assembly protein Cox11
MFSFQRHHVGLHRLFVRRFSTRQDFDNRTALYYGASLIVAMVGASYLAVPIYQMICTQTGLDGTPKTSAGNSQYSHYRPQV